MKTMKSYRMDDTTLGMIDSIKANTNIKTDTEIIKMAITIMFWEIAEHKSEISKALNNDKDTERT